MAEFRCFVSTQTGLPIAEAAIRVLSAQGVDVTALLFAKSPVYTRADGVFSISLPTILGQTGRIPPGVYTITATTPGYQARSVNTLATFTGIGSFTLALDALTDSAAGASLTGPESTYVSPLYPVELLLESNNTTAKWEYIEASITSSAGTTSLLEVIVAAGVARLNLQARLELETGLHLVGDDEAALIDADFSDSFSVTLSSLTPSGRVALDLSLELVVANAAPTGETNDLKNFTNLAGLADWLTPWDELPKFTGHYADAMIWLAKPGLSGYVLQTAFQTINRAPLSTSSVSLDDDLFTTGRVVRIRIPEPVAGAQYASLTILHAGQPQTKPLLVRYIHG